MKYLKFLLIVAIFLQLFSCDEMEVLKEVPLDFYSPENSYTKPEHIEAALNGIYGSVRSFYNGNEDREDIHLGTDLAMAGINPATRGFGDYPSSLTPTSGIVSSRWRDMYRVIYLSNVILNRMSNIEYPTEDKKNEHMGEARFFRGWAYRTLVFFFGGVPIVTEEITTPRRDFVRNTKEEVLAQCVEDFTYAASSLPKVSEVSAEGRLCQAAANHMLTEIYLAQKDWDNAIKASSKVIDDPNFSLMTERFGVKADQEGDPYWDLFQRNNQNRSAGNKEGIWVTQIEFDTPGGGGSKDHWSAQSQFERFIVPLYWYLKDPDGVNGFVGPTSKNGGRGIGNVRPTDHYIYEIWQSDWDNDLRNHSRNIQRDWVFDNPNSAYYGQNVSENLDLSKNDTLRWFFAYPTKLTTKGDHPVAVIQDPATGVMFGSAGATYRDRYMIRLAETYLLRAEAYLGKAQKDKAADDINEVRGRVNATPVNDADVNIDYILDERMRELDFFEQRRLTLSRLGMLVERTREYNPYSGETIEDHNVLYPIPYSEIERNSEAVLEQNPGYTN